MLIPLGLHHLSQIKNIIKIENAMGYSKTEMVHLNSFNKIFYFLFDRIIQWRNILSIFIYRLIVPLSD